MRRRRGAASRQAIEPAQIYARAARRGRRTAGWRGLLALIALAAVAALVLWLVFGAGAAAAA